jgi:Tol biopolymer transport system component
MTVITRPTTAPPMRAAWLVLAALLALALAVGGAIAGANLLRTRSLAVLPPPTGLAANGLIAFDAGGDIWTMRPDGTDRRQITSGPEMDAVPVWSPDGTHLAYQSFAIEGQVATSSEDPVFWAAPFDLVVIDADGNDRHVLASGLIHDSSYGMPSSWAPDSDRLVISHVEDAEPVIDVVPVDGGPAMRVASGHAPTWSPQGDLIAYRSAEAPYGVDVAEPDGSNPRRVTQAYGSGFAFSAPAWSPDGTLIAFYAGPDGAHDVWVARTDGSEEWAIGSEPVEEYWPVFNPDGSRVAFGRNIGSGCCTWNWVVTDPEGSNLVTLDSPSLGAPLPPVWSPDGTILLGRSGDSDAESHPLLHVDATGERPPAEVELDSAWAHFSWQRLAMDG